MDARPVDRVPAPGLGFAVRLILVLVLWACGLSPAAARPSALSLAEAGPRVSVMEVPLSIDLRPLFLRADALLPREVGHWRGWRKQQGIETRYRAWRGPLRMMLAGDLLRVEAHVRYWVQGRKKILGGFDLKAGCGVDEPPRQAVVGLLVRLGWGADWTLQPRFRVLPTRFIDRCEVTAAGIDVSPLIDRLFRGRIEIWARPVFDPQAQRIRLEELGFVLDPQDPEKTLMVDLFYQRLQKALQDGANESSSRRAPMACARHCSWRCPGPSPRVSSSISHPCAWWIWP